MATRSCGPARFDAGPIDLAVASHDLARAMKGDALLLEAHRRELAEGRSR